MRLGYFLICFVIIGIISNVDYLMNTQQYYVHAELPLSNTVKDFKLKGGSGVVAVNPNTDRVFVTNNYADTVSVIDGSTNSLVSVFKVGSGPFGIGINPETDILYVARGHNDILTVVDGSTHNIKENIEISGPYDIAINSNTNLIYCNSAWALAYGYGIYYLIYGTIYDR